jgi:hypothetical protein
MASLMIEKVGHIKFPYTMMKDCEHEIIKSPQNTSKGCPEVCQEVYYSQE